MEKTLRGIGWEYFMGRDLKMKIEADRYRKRMGWLRPDREYFFCCAAA